VRMGGRYSDSRPRISAVIPTFERSDVVGRAIRSALGQVFPPIEVIVVDDGSTDDTERIVSGFEGPVRYVRQTNRGVSSARNRGVNLAFGDWVAFLDSDDVWRPKHLQNVARAIEATAASADYYFADAWIAGGSRAGSWYETCDFDPRSPFEVVEEGFDLSMLPCQPMLIPSTVVRRSMWEMIGGLSEDLPTREDTHMFFLLGLMAVGCAIRSVGFDVAPDGAENLGLTQVYNPESRIYSQATVALYRDVLSRQGVPSQHREELRRRLSDGYWMLAKAEAREGQWVRALETRWHSVSSQPASIGRRLLGAARRFG